MYSTGRPCGGGELDKSRTLCCSLVGYGSFDLPGRKSNMKSKKHAPTLIAVVAVFAGISPAWAFDSRPSPSREQRGPAIAFPGGGLFFYWQAGVVVSGSILESGSFNEMTR